MAEQHQGPTLRPRKTKRTFDLPPRSADSSAPPSPYPEQTSLDIPDPNGNGNGNKDDGLSSRSRSVQNLTASTLFGIYSPTAFEGGGGSGHGPGNGTGTQTPSMRQAGIEGSGSFPTIPEGDDLATAERVGKYTTTSPSPSRKRRNAKAGVGSLVGRSFMLFGFGVAYGVIVTHLHDSPRLAPVRVENIDQGSWEYVVFWGVAGILLGSLLPWFDNVWEEAMGREGRRARGIGEVGRGLAADWYAVVRSVGAFVGIAFAIRKLPWQSTLQVSLTLALVNPVLWYLIDRSKPGFILSTVVGLAGMLVLLGINPEMVPPPATTATATPPASSMAANSSAGDTTGDGGGVMGGGISHEKIAVGTWIASVLFCSCVCFGNIGRRLALGGKGGS